MQTDRKVLQISCRECLSNTSLWNKALVGSQQTLFAAGITKKPLGAYVNTPAMVRLQSSLTGSGLQRQMNDFYASTKLNGTTVYLQEVGNRSRWRQLATSASVEPPEQEGVMAEDKAELRTLYPEAQAYDAGCLKVSDIHMLRYWQYGNCCGKPVIFIHGGPGGGTSGRDCRYFDHAVYRVIVFDQRGAGSSTPAAELRENTTWDLVEDIEKIRKHLGVDRWVVFGGSWGSTLSLVYAQAHPDKVMALVLRGIFNLRRKELEWFYEDKCGASMIYPDHFEVYRDFIPAAEQKDLIGAYYRRLTGEDEAVKLAAAKHWAGWEMATSRLHIDDSMLSKVEGDQWSLQFARIECHYFVHGGFFESDSQLLDNVDKIRHIPATIVQGRYDVVCPADTAWQLHKRWPEAEFYIVQEAGHSAKEPGITSRLVQATDKYRDL